MKERVVICPHCGHKQKSKSKLKNITCSSCQKKFDPENTNINNTEKKKEETNKKVKLD